MLVDLFAPLNSTEFNVPSELFLRWLLVFFYVLICSVNVCNSGLEHVKASKQRDF